MHQRQNLWETYGKQARLQVFGQRGAEQALPARRCFLGRHPGPAGLGPSAGLSARAGRPSSGLLCTRWRSTSMRRGSTGVRYGLSYGLSREEAVPPPPPAARASASAGSALSSGERGSGERVSPRSEKLFMCSSTSTLPGNVGLRSGPGPGPGLGSASGLGRGPPWWSRSASKRSASAPSTR